MHPEGAHTKKAANAQLREELSENFADSITGDQVDLAELLVHFRRNPLLESPVIHERFWQCAIVDAFIDNNDRNNSNWELLVNMSTGERKLAPVYDNGNSFANKSDDEALAMLTESDIVGGRTIGQEAASAG